MDRTYFIQLTSYTTWLNAEVIRWLRRITDEQWEQENASSFPSIRKTVLHIVSAEKIWIDFWQKCPSPVFLSAVFDGTREELLNIWEETTAALSALIQNYPAAAYEAPVVLQWRGETWQMAFWQSFAHFINHATYHRGQLVTLLRQAGYDDLVSTDLASFCRVIL
jgi:uncharacterized damage-inducible protein DinB